MTDLKELLKLAFSVGHAIDRSLADGKIGWTDAVHLVDVVRAAPAALDGISNVPAGLASMDASQKAELLAWSKAEFDLADDKLEAMVESGLQVGLHIATLVASLKK